MTPATLSANSASTETASATDRSIDEIVLRACLNSTKSRPFRQFVKRFLAPKR